MARLPKCKRSAEEIAASALSAWQSRAIAAETQVKKLKAARPKVLARGRYDADKEFRCVCLDRKHTCRNTGCVDVLIIAAPKGKEAKP